MFVNTFFRRTLFNFLSIFIIFFIYYFLFKNLYTSNEIIISFAVHPFNLCEKYPIIWYYIKLLYIPVTLIASLICINTLYSSLFTKKKVIEEKSNVIKSDLHLKIFNDKNNNLIIPEAGLYQNFLITGTIGSGKTSSVMYPFTKQLLQYEYKNPYKKLGMLILDVKGNYYSRVKKYAEYFDRVNDLIVIEIRTVMLNTIRWINPILNLRF